MREQRRTEAKALRRGASVAVVGEVVGSADYFFFSSRRRHTRLQGDWSSDVCSSDLRIHRDRESTWRAGQRQQRAHGLGKADDVPVGDLLRSGGYFSGGANSRPSRVHRDRKSTRLNSSHLVISYAVFCLKKKTDTPYF